MVSELPWPVHPAAARFQMLNDDEMRALVSDIRDNGLNHPVTLYDDPARGTILLDGRNRATACLLAGVPITTRHYKGTRPYAFVISENVRRRHLNAGQATGYVLGFADELRAEREADDLHKQAEEDARRRADEARRRRGDAARAAAADNSDDSGTITGVGINAHTGDPQPKSEKPLKPHRARDDVAEVAGVSGRSVAQFIRVQEQAPDLVEKVMAGEMSLAEAEKEIRQRIKDAERKERERIREEATAKTLATMTAEVESQPDTEDGEASEEPVGEPGGLSNWWELGPHLLYCGDSSDAEFVDACAGARFVFADPPYNAGKADWDRGFVWEHDYLTDVADVVVVTPGISAVADFFKVTAMRYRWSIAAHITNGMTRGALGFGNWIYAAVFSNVDSIHRNAQDHMAISVDATTTHESGHQSRKPARLLVNLIELFTDEGDTVVDPFLGSGTTLFAADATGRRCIGAEIDPTFQAEIIARYGSDARRVV